MAAGGTRRFGMPRGGPRALVVIGWLGTSLILFAAGSRLSDGRGPFHFDSLGLILVAFCSLVLLLALRRGEQRFQALFEAVGDAVFIHDATSGAILDVNRRMLEMYGYTREEALALDVEALSSGCPPHTRGEARVWFGKARAGEPLRFEWRARRRDGTLFWCEMSVRRARIDGGERLVVLVRDIEERRRTLDELHASEGRLREAQRVASLGSWELDLVSGRLEWSDEIFHIFELDPSRFAASYEAFLEATHPDDRERVDRAYRESVEWRTPYGQVHRLRMPDGRIKFVREQGFTHYGADGAPLRSVGTIQEITGQVRRERELERISRFYRVLSHINEAILRFREPRRLFEEACRVAVEDGGFLLAWVALLDEERDELIPAARWGLDEGYLDFLMETGVLRHGGPSARAVAENRRSINNDTATNPRMAPWRDQALRRGFHSSAAFPLRRGGIPVGGVTLYAADPGVFTQELNELFQRLADNLSFALDFHDEERQRRRAEEQSRVLNDQLEARVEARTAELHRVNRELESFTYAVSHDLRAPLRAIDGFSQVLAESYAGRLDPRALDYLGRVRAAAGRMGALIDDLLDLSRIGRTVLERREVDLTMVAERVVAELRAAEPERRVSVAIASGLTTRCDPGLARVVLDNLLGNAWKYTTGTDGAAIELAPWEGVGGIRGWVVRDNGAGFDMRYADKLFTPFQRLHRRDEFDGNGVGLATVRRAIRHHDGSIHAEAAPGCGAAFYFHFGSAG